MSLQTRRPDDHRDLFPFLDRARTGARFFWRGAFVLPHSAARFGGSARRGASVPICCIRLSISQLTWLCESLPRVSV